MKPEPNTEVTDAIETRNDIAHGDWWIGLIALAEDRSTQRLPPRIVRTLPARSDGPRKVVELTIQELDAMSDRLEELLGLIDEFGKLALKIPVMVVTASRRDDESAYSKDEFRVRDVFTIEGGKKAVPARVVRNGPRAPDVLSSIYALSASSRSRRSASD